MDVSKQSTQLPGIDYRSAILYPTNEMAFESVRNNSFL